jgi:hypothetical protein
MNFYEQDACIVHEGAVKFEELSTIGLPTSIGGRLGEAEASFGTGALATFD